MYDFILLFYFKGGNNHGRGSSYIDILVIRTLYMSCQGGPGIEPGQSALKASALPIELTWQTKHSGFDNVHYIIGVKKFER